MSLIKYLELIFVEPSEFRKQSDKYKISAIKPLNQYLAMYAPFTANEMNQFTVNLVALADFWSYELERKKFTEIPRWLWKYSKNNDKIESIFDDKIVTKFCKYYNCTKSDFYSCYHVYQDEFLQEYDNFSVNL